MFVFYWTYSTGRGMKVYAETKEERDRVLLLYIEATKGPVDGVEYKGDPVRISDVPKRMIGCA